MLAQVGVREVEVGQEVHPLVVARTAEDTHEVCDGALELRVRPHDWAHGHDRLHARADLCVRAVHGQDRRWLHRG
jgi:hypothetical protein